MIASASDLPIGFFDQPTSYRGPRTVVLRSEMKTKGKRTVFINVFVKTGKGRCFNVNCDNNGQKIGTCYTKKVRFKVEG